VTSPTRRLYLDVTVEAVVIRCHDCDWWHAIRFTRVAAWEAGREHERRAHPGARQATTRLAYYRHRSGVSEQIR
jgi:hypothetical protein